MISFMQYLQTIENLHGIFCESPETHHLAKVSSMVDNGFSLYVSIIIQLFLKYSLKFQKQKSLLVLLMSTNKDNMKEVLLTKIVDQHRQGKVYQNHHLNFWQAKQCPSFLASQLIHLQSIE